MSSERLGSERYGMWPGLFCPARSVSTPASPTLRRLTAVLLLLAAGVALALPFVSGTLFTLALGGVAIAAGVSQLLRLTGAAGLQARLFRGLSGALYLLGGVSLLAFPVESTLSLTLFLGFLLAIEGVMELAAAASAAVPARGLVLLDGLITAALGGMLIVEWPLSGTWALGTLVGIALAFSAVSLLTAPSSDPAS